ncbi:response regulator [Roseateles violae]|uniref:Response regulator n=1 Tax=Roseateles violae TaxID=3058042 RepID=A0ABT8DYA4_9BURK|nr:response regulator [Pelomonas sp. PFR6]MDN3922334.1 response regulator [Pelomonas sp. PFR6]
MNAPAATRPLRILLVENHTDTRTTLTLLLAMLGHEVRSAVSVGDGLQALAEFAPDVLLSDIGLPDGDGWELLSQIKQPQPFYAVAMSGYGMRADRERSAMAGFKQHLVKPLAVEDIEKMLDEAARELDLAR